MAVSLDIIAFIIFVLLVAAFLWHDRRKIKVTGIVFMRRTSRGKAWLDRTAKRRRRFWSAIALLGALAAVPAMIFITYFVLNSIVQILTGTGASAVQVVLPGPQFEARPGVLLVPWYFWIIGVAILVIPHELAHGVAARLAKVRVKSLGWFLLAVLPGAFVEPDERQLNRAPRSAKLKVYAIGSFVNFITAAVFLSALVILTAVFAAQGVAYGGLAEGGPAELADLSGAILSINGVSTTSLGELQGVLESVPVGSQISIETTTGTFEFTTVRHPQLERSYIGIVPPYQPYYPQPLMFFLNLFNWIFIFTLGVGMFNLLPIKPLDGGKYFEVVVSRFTSDARAASITRAVSILLGFLLIYVILSPLLIG